jgi:hypothetical protein
MARKRARDYVPPTLADTLEEMAGWSRLLTRTAESALREVKASGGLDSPSATFAELDRFVEVFDEGLNAMARLLGLEGNADAGEACRGVLAGLAVSA